MGEKKEVVILQEFVKSSGVILFDGEKTIF